MTATDRIYRLALVEIVAAFVVVMVTLIVMFASGRFDEPYRGAIVCAASAPCEQLLEP